MKTLKPIAGILAAVISVASCTKEAEGTDSAARAGYVDVTVEGSVPATKVTLDDATPLWQKGDKIGVFTSELVLCPAFQADAGNAASTTFSGQKPEYSVLSYAFYPYDASATYSKSGMCLTLPRKQSGRIRDAVMVANGNEKDGFHFHNVTSVIRFKVPASLNVRKVEIVRDDRVSGSFTVNADSFGVTATAPSTYLDSRAEIDWTSAMSGEYVIAVLPSTSKKLEMAFTNGAGKVAFVSKDFTSGNAFVAGRIKNLGTVPTTLTFHDAALVADPTNTQL